MLNLIPTQSISVEKLFAPFDEVFNEVLKGTPLAWRQYATEPTPTAFAPAVECYLDQKASNYHLQTSLPGVDPNEINVEVKGRTITISGERKFAAGERQPQVLHSEFWYGPFKRTMTVHQAVNLDQMKAEYRNGVLEITAPLDQSALSRKIQLQTASEAKQINS